MRRLLRFSGSIRHHFDKLPHWARDIYGLVSYVNFLELVPSLSCIALAPRHFFRRLPSTLSGHRPLFQTPIKFFANFAALFLLLFFLRHGDLQGVVDQGKASWLLLLLVPMTPVFIFVLGAFTYLLYQLPRLAPNGDSFPAPNAGTFRLLLSPLTYFQIHPARFTWGLFYISLYFLAAWQFTQVILGYGFLATAYLSSAIGEGHEVTRAIILLIGIGLAALTIHAFVLRPYVELLRTSMKTPTKAIFQMDAFEIGEVTASFLKESEQSSELNQAARNFESALGFELDRYRSSSQQLRADHTFDTEQREAQAEFLRAALRRDAIEKRLANADSEIRDAILKHLEAVAPSPVCVDARAA